MNGPSTGSSRNKYIFPILVWTAIIASIVAFLDYKGVFDKVGEDRKQEKIAKLTQSSKEETILNGAGDGYDGYAILRSKRFKFELQKKSLALNFIDDKGDYPSRVKKLVSGEYDFAVMPIHDYLEQLYHLGVDTSKAPVIVAAISWSTGSDAVLADPKNFKSINDLKGLLKVDSCYTSRFMLGSMAVDTGLPILLKGKANEDIEQTYADLLSDKCKVAGLWEPYISRAKKQGYEVLMGSNELKLARIVDVYVVNRGVLLEKPESIQNMLYSYYESVSYYANNPTELYSEIELTEGGGKDARDQIEIAENLAGVHFYNLADNSYTLFRANSSSEGKVLDYIDAIVIKLIKMDAIPESPLPNGDSRSIVYDKVLRGVFNSYPDDAIKKPAAEARVYTKLQESTWRKLIRNPKFTRDDLKITFLRDGKLDNNAKAILDRFAQQQIGNFDYYIAIVGKSAQIRGINEEVIQQRTQAKSDRVYKYLQKYYQIDPNRISSIGVGSTMTPAKKAGQSYGNYINDNNTVEIMFIDY